MSSNLESKRELFKNRKEVIVDFLNKSTSLIDNINSFEIKPDDDGQYSYVSLNDVDKDVELLNKSFNSFRLSYLTVKLLVNDSIYSNQSDELIWQFRNQVKHIEDNFEDIIKLENLLAENKNDYQHDELISLKTNFNDVFKNVENNILELNQDILSMGSSILLADLN